MKIVVTRKETFSSKKGTDYVKTYFVNPVTGIGGELFASKQEFDKFGIEIPDMAVNPEVLEALKGIETYEAEFDQKGKLVALKA